MAVPNPKGLPVVRSVGFNNVMNIKKINAFRLGNLDCKYLKEYYFFNLKPY